MHAAQSPTEIRADLRRRLRWLVVAAALLVVADFALLALPVGVAWRVVGAAIAAAVGVAAIALIARHLVMPAIRVLEAYDAASRSMAAEREHSERLASAGRLVATLLHELGNPISAIVNFSHTLDLKVGPDLQPTVQSLQRAAFRIVRLRDGYLDFVRPKSADEAGADFNTALRETLSFLGDQGTLRNIELDVRLPSKPLPTRGTAMELEQAIANLVLNAADAMPEGGRLVIWAERLSRLALRETHARSSDGSSGRIVYPRERDERLERWLDSLDVDDVVKIVVADSGHGFHHDDLEKMFEPFFTTKPADKGFGLGLNLVRRVVDSMQGIVWAQRSREGGAAFHIVLPVHPAQVGAAH